jgi:hypothetical protein
MNTINLKTKTLSTLLVFVLILFSDITACAPNQSIALTVTNIELCDNFDSHVNCTEPKPKSGVVLIKGTILGKEKLNWENFANYLYFTARETPGFVITFSRPFTNEERKSLETNYSAYLTLDGIREKMEGFEIGENKIASFHYLGAILKEVKRHKKEEKQPTNLNSLGTLLLQFEYRLPNGESSSLQRELNLSWK